MVLSLERWRGKVCLITGASAGIGAALASKLVAEGLLVVGVARHIESIEAAAQQTANKNDKLGKLYAVKADVRDERALIAAFAWTEQHVGPISILVNSAAVSQNTDLIDGDTAMWRECIETNIFGGLVATREAIRSMRAHNIDDGHIINMNSQLGHKVVNFPRLNVYAGTKHAVTALSATLKCELMRLGSNIKVTSISPGRVSTDMNNKLVMNPAYEAMLKKSPELDVENVVDTILFVLSTPPTVQINEVMLQAIGEGL